MNAAQLIDKYFEQIEIERSDCVPIDNAVSDASELGLIIPLAVLKEYSVLNGLNSEKLPEGVKLWKESGLVKRLRNSGKTVYREHQPLNDVLDYLEGSVWSNYQALNDSRRIRWTITEIPKFIGKLRSEYIRY
ncbi:Uncharacterised protein [uncultured archaeon]|nr:Uncharacterised protein [uncultured archaeon]